VQAVARVVQHLADAPAVEGLQAFAKALADEVGRGALLAGQQLVVLVDVVVLQPVEGGHGVGQAGGGHAPGADGAAHQVHRLAAAGQPVAEQKAVQRAEDQALGAAGRAGDDADVLRAQAVLLDVAPGGGAGMDAQGFHGLMVAPESRFMDVFGTIPAWNGHKLLSKQD
jgi:hypothetical protein